MEYYTGKHVNLNSYRGGGNNKRRRRRKKFDFFEFIKKPAAMITATAIICTGILGFTFAKAFSYKHVDISEEFTPEDLGVNSDLPEGITNIALFGLDARSTSSFKGNSDSIMILSINTKTAQVKLTSIMRDSLVVIPGYRTTKINAAYAKGGAALAIKTLNQNFGMNITEYATVNFAGMAEIIDAMGGVMVDVSSSELTQANHHIKYLCKSQGTTPDYIDKKGEQMLNGMQAVAYARIRKTKFQAAGTNDDFGRTDRQRYIMEQLLNRALELNATQYPNLIKTCLPYVETSLSYKEILSFAGLLTKDLKFEQSRVPDARYVINAGFKLSSGASSVYYNLDFASKVLHAFIYDDIPTDEYLDNNKINLKGWYQGGGSFITNSSSKPATSDEEEVVTSKDPTSSEDENASDVSSDENESGESSGGEGDNESSSDTENSSSEGEGSSSEETTSSEEETPSSEPQTPEPPATSDSENLTP